MAEEESELLKTIENDEFYKQFLHTGTKNTLANSLSIAEQVKKLGEGIEIVGKELQKQVLNKHDDLLRQANHATKLENVLNTMNVHVQNLLANAERLRGQINGPYNALENHTRILGRLHLASHILRQVNRIQQLNRRLSNTNDPIQKASLLQELEQLAADPDLKEVDVVTTELRNIRVQQKKIVSLTSSSLNQGIANENVAQTTTALQIFLNLGTINDATQKHVDLSLAECSESLKSALDVTSGIGGVTGKPKVTPGRTMATPLHTLRNRIWSDLDKAFSEEIYQQCKQIKFLQSILNDLNAHGVSINIADKFWKKLGQNITEEIQNASSSVQQMLEEDFPTLLKCYYEMTNKLKYPEFVYDRTVLEKCENSYLSSALTRLLEPTQSMFGGENSVPTQEQVDALIRSVTSELSVALLEKTLSDKVAKNISKCIKMYAVKTEQQLATGTEAAQVIGNANNGQRLNVQLANMMYYFQSQVQRMLGNMKESVPKSSLNIINDSLQSLDVLMSAILQPLIGSISATIETIIITIHQEPDWGKLQVPANKTSIPCSPYMRELTQFISRVYQSYLAPFDNKEVMAVRCNDVSIRCIELLVLHTCLLRPVSQGGRLRLRSDFHHVEQALKIICPNLSDLGRPYRLLKSIATLVALTPEEIVASQVSGSCVPASTVLLLLFTFAGPELASPHQNTGWSIPKLSVWLDEHISEAERLDLVAGALQRYETIVRQKNSVNYDPVYPIMFKFLETATNSNK